MTTLRRKVIAWVSTIVVALTLVALPGCKGDEGTQKQGATQTETEPNQATDAAADI